MRPRRRACLSERRTVDEPQIGRIMDTRLVLVPSLVVVLVVGVHGVHKRSRIRVAYTQHAAKRVNPVVGGVWSQTHAMVGVALGGTGRMCLPLLPNPKKEAIDTIVRKLDGIRM